ncbi:late embryogenesis abundant protein At1g64065 [Cucurbita pepo subsp. pepo]|uniref:late embryogenesis abundant protein At1g64065 n=1 Tax=Cucurbita pepo subsp. pepo TaxID=3664 RepID=UPI000C9D310A|nr:late embryogenesis abundant protein At1g64065 [Cucurbita pepo subsp. pepo]
MAAGQPPNDRPATLRSRRKASEKCINTFCIYLFAIAAVACIAALILGLVVVRVKTPTVKLTSVTVKNLHYGFSPTPFMDATLIAEITMENPNFGEFKYEEVTNTTLIYYGVAVGIGEVKTVSVNAKSNKKANFTVKVKPNSSFVDVDYFSHDLAMLKTMNMSCIAEFKGRVRLLKLFKEKKVSMLKCTMSLNLSSHGVQNLACQ